MTETKEEHTPLGNIGFGILLIVVGVGCYFWFAHLEAEGGRIRTHALILLAYSLLGKWGVLGLFGGLGTLLAVFGIKDLILGKSTSHTSEPKTGQDP